MSSKTVKDPSFTSNSIPIHQPKVGKSSKVEDVLFLSVPNLKFIHSKFSEYMTNRYTMDINKLNLNVEKFFFLNMIAVYKKKPKSTKDELNHLTLLVIHDDLMKNLKEYTKSAPAQINPATIQSESQEQRNMQMNNVADRAVPSRSAPNGDIPSRSAPNGDIPSAQDLHLDYEVQSTKEHVTENLTNMMQDRDYMMDGNKQTETKADMIKKMAQDKFDHYNRTLADKPLESSAFDVAFKTFESNRDNVPIPAYPLSGPVDHQIEAEINNALIESFEGLNDEVVAAEDATRSSAIGTGKSKTNTNIEIAETMFKEQTKTRNAYEKAQYTSVDVKKKNKKKSNNNNNDANNDNIAAANDDKEDVIDFKNLTSAAVDPGDISFDRQFMITGQEEAEADAITDPLAPIPHDVKLTIEQFSKKEIAIQQKILEELMKAGNATSSVAPSHTHGGTQYRIEDRYLLVNGGHRDFTVEPHRSQFLARINSPVTEATFDNLGNPNGTRIVDSNNIEMSLTNLYSFEISSVVIPAFSHHTTINPQVSVESTPINLPYPYVIVNIERMEGNMDGSNSALRSAFCTLFYDRSYIGAHGRGFIVLKPMQGEKKVWTTPGNLTNMNISLQSPIGNLMNYDKDGHIYVEQVTRNTTTSFLIRVRTPFHKNEFNTGDIVIFKNFNYTDIICNDMVTGATGTLNTFLNNANGHLITGISNITSTIVTNTATNTTSKINTYTTFSIASTGVELTDSQLAICAVNKPGGIYNEGMRVTMLNLSMQNVFNMKVQKLVQVA
jgi:hypothetical protein